MHRTVVATLCIVLVSGASAGAQRLNASSSATGWRRGGVCYEIFVRSFYDSNGDGVGDLNGLIQKLDYINDGNASTQSDLGASCIWLMPVAESPSYHGYDVTNYYRVEPDYGTNQDFKRLVAEAHRRGIRVLVDLVLNHMSSQHPFFQEALRDPASPHRNWFLWSATKPETKGPWGQEAWHRSPIRDEYYYGVFWSGMPDLNNENPAVRDEAKKVARYWLKEMGADGFRLDAVAYLVEDGGRLEHSPGTHAFLRDFATYVRQVAPGAFTIGEVSDSIGALFSYYPDQLDGYFAFEVSDAILAAVRTGSAKNLFAPVLRLQRELPADRWSPFLRNHDQTRTLTALGGDVGRAKLAATILLTLPGLPFVYYGEEIGMTGDKPDERLRTPMHWSGSANAGFTRGIPWEAIDSDSLTANVAFEDTQPSSLLNLYRRLIHLRAKNAALGAGELQPLAASNDAVAAYLRRYGDRVVLIVANLSGTPLGQVSLSSAKRVLPPGAYAFKDLLGARSAAPLRIGSDGRINAYIPLRSLGAMESFLFELSNSTRQRVR
jgi:alpha-amylase